MKRSILFYDWNFSLFLTFTSLWKIFKLLSSSYVINLTTDVVTFKRDETMKNK